MPARVRLALGVALTLAALGALALVLTAGSKDEPAGFAGSVRPAIPPQDFVLRDEEGARVSLRKLRGEVVIVTFLYSTCEDTCPITASQIRGALDDLGRDVPALAVSVDPANDTAASARAFLVRRRVRGRMRFLLGTRAELAPVWKAYGIRPQRDALEHSAYVVLVDRAGRQRIGFPFDKLTSEGLVHDLRLLLREKAPAKS